MKSRSLAALGLLLLVSAASADTALYDLDANNANEIADALKAVLYAKCTEGPKDPITNQSRCRVELLPTGQLLVEAPAESQAQIGAVIKAIAARNASPTPRVTLQYWVVYGEPGKPDASDSALRPLSSVLQQLERLHGELRFSVQDTTSITAQSGTSAQAVGGALQIAQRVRASGDTLELTAEVSFMRAREDSGDAVERALQDHVNVTVSIRRGEYVVLAERGSGDVGKPGMLFYVVHWPEGR